MARMSIRNIDSPIGRLGIRVENGALVEIVFGGFDADSGEDALLDCVQMQLEEYFAGKRREFDVPLAPKGTDFQKKVWNALLQIPYGCTDSYSGIAEKIGSPKAARAVGMANHVNPIPVIVPCHRVVGKGGKLVGYAGGLDMKTTLLDIEKQNK